MKTVHDSYAMYSPLYNELSSNPMMFQCISSYCPLLQNAQVDAI